MLRNYYYDDAGRDITLDFFQKGTVVFAADSFNNGTSSNDYIYEMNTRNQTDLDLSLVDFFFTDGLSE